MDGRYTWSLVAEVVRATCGVDALADFMVLGGTGEVERSSTDLRARSWLLCASEAVQMRPLGQGGRPASAGECTARPSAHGVGMEHGRLWWAVESRTSARARGGYLGGAEDIDAYSSGGHFRAETFYFLGCTLPI